MEVIKHQNEILAIVYREADWKEGLNFFTPEDFYVQVGSWYYQKGKRLQDHTHKVYERKTLKTHEMTHIKKGSMKVFLYDEKKAKLKEFVLKTGDTAVFAGGGHGYEILEDGTQVLEAKNGPFISVEKDKDKF